MGSEVYLGVMLTVMSIGRDPEVSMLLGDFERLSTFGNH